MRITKRCQGRKIAGAADGRHKDLAPVVEGVEEGRAVFAMAVVLMVVACLLLLGCAQQDAQPRDEEREDVASVSDVAKDSAGLTIDHEGEVTNDKRIEVGGAVSDSESFVSWEVFQEGTDEPFASGESVVYKGRWQADGLVLRPGINTVSIVSESGSSLTGTITYEGNTFKEIEPDHVRLDPDTDIAYVDDVLYIAFKRDLSEDEAQAIVDEIGGEELGRLWGANVWQVRVPQLAEGTLSDAFDFAFALQGRGEVIAAMPDTAQITMDESTWPKDPWLGQDGKGPEGWSEESPSGSNWGYEAIHAASARSFVQNHAPTRVTVGVADGLFDGKHEDLRYSFVTERQRLANTDYILSKSEMADGNKKELEKLYDSIDHGMHVAGIIGAEADNEKGITGVCDCDILVASVSSSGVESLGQDAMFAHGPVASTFDLLEAGARVINCSMGIDYKNSENTSNEQIIKNTEGRMCLTNMLKAIIGQQLAERRNPNTGAYDNDFVIVQCAGNGVVDYDGIPVDARLQGLFAGIVPDSNGRVFGISPEDIFDRILVVGNAAMNKGEGVAFVQAASSNGGTRVDLCAPGTHILSLKRDNGYRYLDGTSMAAPFVSGTAALMFSVNPNLSGADVKRIITETATADVAVSPVRDRDLVQLPSHLLDAFAAVQAAYEEATGKETKAQDRVATTGNEVRPNLGASNRYLTSDGEYLYFTGVEPGLKDSSTFGIWRMRMDGSGLEEIYIAPGGEAVCQVEVEGDRLIASVGWSIVAMNKDGSDAVTIARMTKAKHELPRFAVSDGRVYFGEMAYNAVWSLNSVKFDGSDAQTLCGGRFDAGYDSNQIDVWGVGAGRVVMTLHEPDLPADYHTSLCAVPVEGGDATVVQTMDSRRVAVVDGYIYSMTSCVLTRIRADAPPGAKFDEVFWLPQDAKDDTFVLLNVSDDFAFVEVTHWQQDGINGIPVLWRIDLHSGEPVVLGEQRLEGANMELADDAAYLNFEGHLERHDLSFTTAEFIS